MRNRMLLLATTALVLFAAAAARAQAPVTPVPAENPEPANLKDLLAEAERNNPRILAARHAWQGAKQVPSQVSTLPDPQFMVQQFSVGSPRPFAGYSNSDFAYIGFGVSQDFPYPGKLHLRGELAKQDAEIAQQGYESVRRSILAELKAAYYRLAYAQQTLDILERDAQLLAEVEQAADARYRSGLGSQQEVLQAQLEKTKLLREATMTRLEKDQLEAQMKQLLNRPQAPPDLVAEKLSETPLSIDYAQLEASLASQNPDLRAAKAVVDRQHVAVDLARKDFYPDFNLQYMWQHNADQFRDYYMLTFGVRIPIHRRRKQRPELVQAQEQLESSRRAYEAQGRKAEFELREQYQVAQRSAELLKIYREGLGPQANATFQAGLVAYQANRRDFQALLTAFLDVLRFDEEFAQTLAEHETALARLEELTGLELH